MEETPQFALPPRIQKKRGTTRERTGCLTCRQRYDELQCLDGVILVHLRID
jgi:hypothetical protein